MSVKYWQYPQGGNAPPSPQRLPSPENDDDIYMPEQPSSSQHHEYPPDDFDNWRRRNNMDIQHPPTITDAWQEEGRTHLLCLKKDNKYG